MRWFSKRLSVSTAILGVAVGAASAQSFGPPGGTSASPSGPAGGDLTGTYPNPTIAAIMGTSISGVTGTGNVVLSASPTLSPAANAAGLTVSGGSITGSSTVVPGISITGTLNTSGVVDGAAIFANITNTASASTSSLLDLQVSGSSVFQIRGNGGLSSSNDTDILQGSARNLRLVTSAGAVAAVRSDGVFALKNNSSLGWSVDAGPQDTIDTFLSRAAAATIQFGAADAASPVAQTLGVQGGSGTNIAGVNTSIVGSLSTGTANSGDLIFQTGVRPNISGATQATATTALTIKGETQQSVFGGGSPNSNYQVTVNEESGNTNALFVNGVTFISGSLFASLANSATTSAVCYNTSTSVFTYDGTIGTCTVSDARLKTVDGPITDALTKLLQIDGIYFHYKDEATLGAGRKIGVMAQTVEAVFPELVETGSSGLKSVDYQKLVAPIIEGIREINDRLERVERKTAWIDSLPISSPLSTPSLVPQP